MRRGRLLTFVTLLILVGSLFALLPAAAGAERPFRHVTDKTERLTDGQLSSLETKCAQLSDRLGVQMYVVFTHEYGYIGEEFCRDYGISPSEDVILLVLYRSSSEWYYDLYTYGAADRRITGAEVDRILDHPDVYDAIKERGDVYSGVSAYLDLAAKAYEGKLYPPVGALLLFTLGGASVITAITVGVAVGIYRKKQKRPSYPLDKYASLDLKTEQDVFQGITTSRRRVSSSSSGGGRSGGGGGGAGHRGGR